MLTRWARANRLQDRSAFHGTATKHVATDGILIALSIDAATNVSHASRRHLFAGGVWVVSGQMIAKGRLRDLSVSG